MRFKILIFTVMALLLLIPYRVQSQNTAPKPIKFEIFDPDYRIQYPIWGEVQWENTYGSSIKWVEARVDSLRDYLNGIERLLKVSIDSFGVGTDTLPVYVTVYGEAVFDGPEPFTPYLDSLLVHAENEVFNADFYPGIDIQMPDSANVNPGDTLKAVFLMRSLNENWERRLVIHVAGGSGDTIAVGGAPIATSAVSNDYEYLNLRFYGCPISADTTFQLALGHMTKDKAALRWAGDGNDATVLKDSTFKYDDDFTPRANAPNLIPITHAQSDSIYFIWYTASTTGRQIIKWVEILQHN